MHFTAGLVTGLSLAAGLASASPCGPGGVKPIKNIDLGPRPFFLVDAMEEGPLKKKLTSCKEKKMKPSLFSIGHRGGGTLLIPEHSKESNMAGARMGSAILECDVAFTKDRELVCRHAQCDLHTTTNIVTIPELNAKCTQPFEPAANGKSASAKCCTSDLTLKEFKTLCGKMDSSNPNATTPEEFLGNGPDWRTELYATCGEVLSHKEHIALVDDMGLMYTPELKEPEVEMPFEGDYTQEMYAQQMVDDYKKAGIDPSRVWIQSFVYDDILYWLKNEPEFAEQAVYLDETGDTPETFEYAVGNLTQYKEDGVKIIAPPFNYLLTVEDGEIVPSSYAIKANDLDLEIIAWSFERSGPLATVEEREDYYYGTFAEAVKGDGDMYKVLDILVKEAGVSKMFSDWSSTVTFYANCFNIDLLH